MADIRVMREDLRPPKEPPKRHLISIEDLTRDDVERLLGTARTFASSLDREVKKLPTLKGRLVVNLFYESSTRTSSSFELAAKRLSADTLTVKSVGSSVDKGESLKDTALTLGAYDPDVVVIRHPQIGSPQLVARVTDAHVVNAGDGKHQHPTQALLDLYTIQQELGRLEGLHVAIVSSSSRPGVRRCTCGSTKAGASTRPCASTTRCPFASTSFATAAITPSSIRTSSVASIPSTESRTRAPRKTTFAPGCSFTQSITPPPPR